MGRPQSGEYGDNAVASPRVRTSSETASQSEGQCATIHTHGHVHLVSVEEDSANTLVPDDYDLFIDLHKNAMAIRRHNGATITYRGEIPRMGLRSLSLLFALLPAPGEYVPEQGSCASEGAADGSIFPPVAARLEELRRCFGENVKEPWFFVEDAHRGVAFNSERSYCVLSETRLSHR